MTGGLAPFLSNETSEIVCMPAAVRSVGGVVVGVVWWAGKSKRAALPIDVQASFDVDRMRRQESVYIEIGKRKRVRVSPATDSTVQSKSP